MNLPNVFHEKTDWVIVGPLGPALPAQFAQRPLLAVDGGIKHAPRFEFWVGDGDSGAEPQDQARMRKLPLDKDKSDLGCALDLFPGDKNYHLHLWGFSGGRHDHELFVLGEIYRFLKQKKMSRCSIYLADGKLLQTTYSAGDWKLDLTGVFSLAVLEKAMITLTGDVAYPVSQPTTFEPLSSLGLSNRGRGQCQISSDRPFTIWHVEER